MPVLTTKVDERASDAAIVAEAHVIGEDDANTVILYEVPKAGVAVVVNGTPAGGGSFVEISGHAPDPGEYRVRYSNATRWAGRIDFNAVDNGTSVTANYTGLGSYIFARDVNRLHVRLHEIALSVTQYGALGDGVHDDTTAIQATLDAVNAAGGGVVLFPKGTFLISAALRFHANTIVLGAGRGATIIKYAASCAVAGYGFIAATTPISNVGFRDFTIDLDRVTRGLPVDQTYAGINIANLTNVTVEGVEIKNTSGPGIVGGNTYNAHIRKCETVSTGHHCVYLAGNVDGLWVEDCVLGTPHADADAAIGGEIFKLRSATVSGPGSQQWNMNNIYFLRNNCGGVRGAATVPAVYLSAGDGANCGWWNNVTIADNTFNKDNSAMAAPQQVLFVAAGAGVATNVKFLRNKCFAGPAVVAGSWAVRWDASGWYNNEISHNTFSNYESGVVAYDARVEHNTITGGKYGGFGGARCVFAYNRVTSAVSGASGGYYTSESDIIGNVIDLTGAGGTSYGVRSDGSTGHRIEGNRITAATFGVCVNSGKTHTGNTYGGNVMTTVGVPYYGAADAIWSETAILTTTDATQTTIWSSALQDDRARQIRAHVLGFKRGTTTGASFIEEALVTRKGAGATLVEQAQRQVFPAATTAACTFDVSGTSIRLRVTGIAAETWYWNARIEQVESS